MRACFFVLCLSLCVRVSAQAVPEETQWLTYPGGIDLRSADLRRLVINAAYWGIGLEASISATRSVDIVGSYQPLESGFNYEEPGVKPQPVSFYR